MKECCGDERHEELLEKGLRLLKDIHAEDASKLSAANPHELLRSLEALSVLANAELVLQASLARRASSKQLNFARSDYPEMDPPEWHKFVTVKNTSGGIVFGEKAIDYYGSLSSCYEAHNSEYLVEEK
jgi:succinate dehydrogenase/fumarate reductase flavoprotein subunit